MSKLYVAWQDPETRRWSAVGRLSREGNAYVFVYTKGAELSPSFTPFPRMAHFDVVYSSDTLFPLFANRLLTKSRRSTRASSSGSILQRVPMTL